MQYKCNWLCLQQIQHQTGIPWEEEKWQRGGKSEEEKYRSQNYSISGNFLILHVFLSLLTLLFVIKKKKSMIL